MAQDFEPRQISNIPPMPTLSQAPNVMAVQYAPVINPINPSRAFNAITEIAKNSMMRWNKIIFYTSVIILVSILP